MTIIATFFVLVTYLISIASNSDANHFSVISLAISRQTPQKKTSSQDVKPSIHKMNMIERIEHDIEAAISKSSTFVTRSFIFKKFATQVYNDIEKHGSDTIGANEMYVGFLLLHLKLAKFAGPSACKPPSEIVVKKYFKAMDNDKNGRIDAKEFLHASIILCSQIATRIALQWSMSLFLVPNVAKFVIRSYLNRGGKGVMRFKYFRTLQEGSKKNFILHLPYVILTSILGAIGIPLLLDQIDKFFLDVALLEDGEQTKISTNY